MVLACIAQFWSSRTCQVPSICYGHIESSSPRLWSPRRHERNSKVPNSSWRSFNRSLAVRTHMVRICCLSKGLKLMKFCILVSINLICLCTNHTTNFERIFWKRFTSVLKDSDLPNSTKTYKYIINIHNNNNYLSKLL